MDVKEGKSENTTDIESYMAEKAAVVNEALASVIRKESSDRYMAKVLGKADYEYDSEGMTKGILEPSWYLLEAGGKRWRPILCMTVMEALGKKPEDYAKFAAVIEIIHNATLIQDDIEDSSVMRRGVPALHVKFGEDIAINTANFLYFFPMGAILSSTKISDETKYKIASAFVRDMTRISLGQNSDIAWHRGLVRPENITEEKYLQMTLNKTGVLSRFACELGAILSGADDETAEILGRFGATIGVAFQIQDDILNIYESGVSETKGGVGDDITEGKITLLVIHALKNSEEEGRKRLLEILSKHTKDREKIEEAIEIIDRSGAGEYARKVEEELLEDAWKDVNTRLPDSAAKNRLRDIATFLINRRV